MNKVKIVAEIGCNHNGSLELAKTLVEEASRTGCDAVKFQMFNAKELVSCFAQKAEYQKKNTNKDESQLDMISKLELSQGEYITLKEYAEGLGLQVFSTAFDLDSIAFLHSIGQNIWKIPSGEITNLPYLEKIRDLVCEEKEIILSTGMSTLDEITFATNLLEQSKNTKLTILHCNTDYPTKDSDMNLLALHDLKVHFPKWQIGLSDHSEGTVASVVAVGMGSLFIEKHFTLDKSMEGPDHLASINPEELKRLCDEIRRAERMLGCNHKEVTQSEKKNKYVARKSIVAKKSIKKGEIFTEENITCKRPGNGISPIYWYDIIGKTAESDFQYDELITCSGYEWEQDNE